MATAIGALKGFLHIFSADWVFHEQPSDHVLTVLDVLE